MILSPPPLILSFDVNGRPNTGWVEWFSSSYRVMRFNVGSGPTTGRPLNGLIAGDTYFDTTLGKPIWYKGPGWVDGAGGAV
jgi:hypothetical protein